MVKYGHSSSQGETSRFLAYTAKFAFLWNRYCQSYTMMARVLKEVIKNDPPERYVGSHNLLSSSQVMQSSLAGRRTQREVWNVLERQTMAMEEQLHEMLARILTGLLARVLLGPGAANDDVLKALSARRLERQMLMEHKKTVNTSFTIFGHLPLELRHQIW